MVEDRFVCRLIRKELLSNDSVIPEGSVRQSPHVPPWLFFQEVGDIGSGIDQVDRIMGRIPWFLTPGIEVRLVSAAKDIDPSGKATVNQGNRPPAPEPTMQDRKVVVCPSAVLGRIVENQSLGYRGAAKARTEKNMGCPK